MSFDWSLWFTHVLMSIMAISGYMAFYNVLWRLAYGDNATAEPLARKLARSVVLLLPVGATLILAYAVYIDPMNELFYRNLQLLIMQIMMLDDRLTLREFAARAVVFLGYVLILVVLTGLSMPVIAITLGAAVAECFYIRLNLALLHYNYPRIFVLGVLTGMIVWLLQVKISPVNAIGALVNYLLMLSFAFVLWKERHDADMQQKSLTRRVNVDELTQVQTYARFRADIGALDGAAAVVMAMLDIDHFKQINDEYGHMAGNAILVGIAEQLQDLVGATGCDFQIYRTGGEEFNLIFNASDLATVRQVMLQCWQTIRNQRFVYEGRTMQVTISVGIAVQHDGETGADLYKRTDANLYLSKRRGRDTITIEGVTEQLSAHQVATHTFTYYTRPVVEVASGEVLQYDLDMNAFIEERNRWHKPRVFDVTLASKLQVLARIWAQRPTPAVSLELPAGQFFAADTPAQLAAFTRARDGLDATIVQLSQLPELPELRQVLQNYHNHGVQVELTRVDHFASPDAIAPYLALIDGLKFNLDAVRDEDCTVRSRIKEWLEVANRYNLEFTLLGIETPTDVAMAEELGVLRVQGSYYARPTMPQLR